ncbi:unnamed protein product [Pieris brassicae]|uniref:Uncharacterized protein n=1 Tax=Pieris brassicae TaxID=7116 RepID=A0A9P0TUW7_PIEBR|nr:unnamed protein product [Pieris brassicae]
MSSIRETHNDNKLTTPRRYRKKQETRILQVVLLTEVSEQCRRLVLRAVRILLSAAMNLTSARKLPGILGRNIGMYRLTKFNERHESDINNETLPEICARKI